MDTKKVEVSILIVNYNQQKDLMLLLKSFKNLLKNITYEVLVFDNSCNLKKSNYYNLYTLGENIGYGAAINYLAMHAVGNNYMIVNPDSTIKPNVEHVYTDFLSKGLPYGVCSLGVKDKLYTLPFFTRFTRKHRFSSFAFFVDKNVFKSLGGFDPNYFFYFEDDDFALELMKFNVKTYYPKKVCAVHKKTYTNINLFKRRYLYYSSLIYFLKKNYKIGFIVFYIPLKIMQFFYKQCV
jgi:GT2 family glycosyltransferase